MFAEPVKFPFSQHDLRHIFTALTSVDDTLFKYFEAYYENEYSGRESEEPYYDMSEISRHIVQRMRQNDEGFLPAFFNKVEYILNNCDGFTEELIVIGLFESLQGESGQYNYKYHTCFDQWLQPKSKKGWDDLIAYWENGGKKLNFGDSGSV